MRGLKSLQFDGISQDVAAELTVEMTRTSYFEDPPVMYAALAQYVSMNLNDGSGHYWICDQVSEYVSMARLAMELNYPEMFKRSRERVLLLIDEHQGFG